MLIAGGGPAGAATALSLRARGVGCVVLEPERSAAKVGETLPPGAAPLLQRLGIGDLLREPEHLRCYGNRFLWGRPGPEDRSFFSGLHPHGWHLDRRLFEQQLRERAEGAGAAWIEGAEVQAVERSGEGWQVSVGRTGERPRRLGCALIVDATGRALRIGRGLGVKRRSGDRLLGLTCRVSLEGRAPSPQITLIEAVEGGWWYAAKVPGEALVLAFMTDADLLDPAMLEPRVYLERAAATSLLGAWVSPSAAPSAIESRSASTSFASARHGPGWLAVGDAAFAFDPLSSYGLVSALGGGYYAGHAAADWLAGADEAFPAYDLLLSEAFDRYLAMAHAQYLQEQRWSAHPFWQRRHRPSV